MVNENSVIKIPNKNISILDLSNQNLKHIPEEIFELKNLKKLNLSNNGIKIVSKHILRLSRLESLDLSKNNISTFYSKICELKKLKYLNLNNNQIKTIPKQISQLENLKTLSIANNKISNLTDSITNLKNINKLNISKNKFKIFPPEILKINTLKYLWINDLELEDFPVPLIVNELTQLKGLYCYSYEKVYLKDGINNSYKLLSLNKGNCMKIINELKKDVVKKPKKTEPVNKSINMMESVEKNKIFISYSHKDDEWRDKIQTNLRVLQFENYGFDSWDDKRLRAGDNWQKEIQRALERASIAILIVSTNFLASNFVQTKELPKLLDNASKNGTRILCVIVGTCRFTKHPQLGKFQSVNDPSKPLNSLRVSEEEQILVKLTDEVAAVLGMN